MRLKNELAASQRHVSRLEFALERTSAIVRSLEREIGVLNEDNRKLKAQVSKCSHLKAELKATKCENEELNEKLEMGKEGREVALGERVSELEDLLDDAKKKIEELRDEAVEDEERVEAVSYKTVEYCARCEDEVEVFERAMDDA